MVGAACHAPASNDSSDLCDVPRSRSDPFPMAIDRVKEAFEVAIHRVAASFLPSDFHLAHRLVSVAAFAKAITSLAKSVLEERSQHLRYAC